MHISYTKSFNIPVSIEFATLAHMINVYEICINTTNYPIFNMQGFIYWLWTSILKQFWSAGIPTMLWLDTFQWYSRVKHKGHIFNSCSSFSADVANRKGQFIGCVNSIITKFGFADPVCQMKLLVTHGYSFDGSPLWDLYGNACNHLYTTWNIAVCILYDLPRTAHTRLLYNFANLLHIENNLKCRFI